MDGPIADAVADYGRRLRQLEQRAAAAGLTVRLGPERLERRGPDVYRIVCDVELRPRTAPR